MYLYLRDLRDCLSLYKALVNVLQTIASLCIVYYRGSHACGILSFALRRVFVLDRKGGTPDFQFKADIGTFFWCVVHGRGAGGYLSM